MKIPAQNIQATLSPRAAADYEDPTLEAEWIVAQRDIVQRYLQDQGVQACEVSSRPDWFVAPYVSVWKIESNEATDSPGWWVISGDLPTDYLPGPDAVDARAALAAFADRWREVSAYMLRGQEHPSFKIGRPENRRDLGELLEKRAEIIAAWSSDDSIWENGAT